MPSSAKFKKWLNAPDPSVSLSHNNAREKHLEGSGQWLGTRGISNGKNNTILSCGSMAFVSAGAITTNQYWLYLNDNW